MEIKRISSFESNLVVELFDKYRVFYKQPSNIELANTFIQARLDNNESVIFVAMKSEGIQITPIGFMQLYPKFSSGKAIKIWVLNDLYVEPEYRKQGTGERLIQTALKFAREDGASYVELSTAVDNHNAQSLYESLGFIRQEPSSDFFNYRIIVG